MLEDYLEVNNNIHVLSYIPKKNVYTDMFSKEIIEISPNKLGKKLGCLSFRSNKIPIILSLILKTRDYINTNKIDANAMIYNGRGKTITVDIYKVMI